MREFTLSYSRVNFVNTYRVRITHDSLKLKMLEALKQKQQDQLTIIWAQVVPIKDHIDLAQFAKRVKEPAVVLIPWISQDHPFCRVLPSDTSIKDLLKNNCKVNCATVNHCPELTGEIIIIINEHASVFNLNTVEGKSVKFAFRRCFNVKPISALSFVFARFADATHQNCTTGHAKNKTQSKSQVTWSTTQKNIMAFSALVNTCITLFRTFLLYGGRKTSDGETFFLVFLNLDMVLRIIQLQESAPTFEKVSDLE